MKNLKEMQDSVKSLFRKRKREKVQKKEDIVKRELEKRSFDSTKDVGASIWEYLDLK